MLRVVYINRHDVTLAVGCFIALVFWQVGSKYGVVECVEVDWQRMIAFVVKPDLTSS